MSITGLLLCVVSYIHDFFTGSIHNIVRDDKDLSIYAEKVFIGSFTSPVENALIFPSAVQYAWELDSSLAVVYSYIEDCDLSFSDKEEVRDTKDIYCSSKPDEDFTIGCYENYEGNRYVAPNSVVHILLPETKLVVGNELKINVFRGSKVKVSGPNIDTLFKLNSIDRIDKEPSNTPIESSYNFINTRIREINIDDQSAKFIANVLSADNLNIKTASVNSSLAEGGYYKFVGNVNLPSSGIDNIECYYSEYECPELTESSYNFNILPQQMNIDSSNISLYFYKTISLEIMDSIENISIYPLENDSSEEVEIFVFESQEGMNYIEIIGKDPRSFLSVKRGVVKVNGKIINVYIKDNVSSLLIDFGKRVYGGVSNVHFESRLRDLETVIVASTTFSVNVMNSDNLVANCDYVAIGSFEGKYGEINANNEIVMGGNPLESLEVVILSPSSKIKRWEGVPWCWIKEVTTDDSLDAFKRFLFSCDEEQESSQNILMIRSPDIELYLTPVDTMFPTWIGWIITMVFCIVFAITLSIVIVILLKRKEKRGNKEIEKLFKDKDNEESVGLLSSKDSTSGNGYDGSELSLGDEKESSSSSSGKQTRSSKTEE